jgi:hypothetical protein
MNTAFRLAAAFVLTLAASGRLGAQSYRSFFGEYETIVKEARLSFGPFRIFPALRLKNVGYDDNVYFGSAGTTPDYTATVSPEVRIFLPVRQRWILWLSENPEYAFFLRERDLRGWTNSASAGVRGLLFGRFILAFEYGAGESRRPVSSELPLPAKDRSRGWKAEAFIETARQSFFGVSAGVRSIGYEDASIAGNDFTLSRVFDREERFASFEFYYRIFSASHLFLSVRRDDYRFSFEESRNRNALATSISAGVRFPVLGRVQGRISLGYKSFAAGSGNIPGYSGLIGDTGFEASLGRWGLRLAYSRDIVFSFYEENGYYVEQRLGPGVFVRLTDFLRLGYNLGLGRSDYPVPSGTANEGGTPGRARSDAHVVHTADLVLRVYRTYGAGISVSTLRWNSEAAGIDRRRTFVGLALTSRF